MLTVHHLNAWVAYVNNGDKLSLYPDSLWNKPNLPAIGERGFKPGTIGYIPTKLGYLNSEWYVWLSPNTDAVIFKSFTQTPICVLVNSDNAEPTISPAQFKSLISKFNYSEEFSVERQVKGTIRKSFMEEALGIKARDNAIKDSINGYTYYFDNAFLLSAVPEDGLSEFARRAKGTDIFNIIKANASIKHNNNSDINREINFQFWCLANMPPEHFRLAYNGRYNYNIALIWFALYGVENNAKLSDFMFYVPDAETFDVSGDSIIMRWGSNIFVFENDILVNVK